jgi:hypothetical protein
VVCALRTKRDGRNRSIRQHFRFGYLSSRSAAAGGNSAWKLTRAKPCARQSAPRVATLRGAGNVSTNTNQAELIYGPVPGTPFYERVIRENLLQDIFTKDSDLYYRRADGFTTMIKHPTLSPEAIENLQRWCFEQDYQRLGPSIFRVLETRFLGYQTLKDSPNPFLRQKAEWLAKEVRAAYPVFLAGRLLGPNGAVRLGIGDLQRRLHSELGRSGLAERVQSVLALGAALWTGLTLKLGLFQHPRLTRTSYRVPTQRSTGFDLWNEFQRRTSIPDLSIQVELQPAKQQVCLRLEGALSPTNAESLSQRIQDFMARTRSRLVLDLKRLNWDKVGDLAPLRERLTAYRSRIRLILPKLSATHPELILLASAFHQYKA